MTREEAIKRFQQMKKILSIHNSDAARLIEAIDMAIEALQNEETINTQLANCQHGRLIDADALMEKIYDSTYPLYSRQFEGYVIPMSRLEEIINNAPTVSARPHGEWLYYDYDNLRCSNCNYHFGQRHMVYCPNCGAQMDMRWESEKE